MNQSARPKRPRSGTGRRQAAAGRPETGPTPRGPRAPVPVCPIAVIGASAGGLDAFKKFFGAMPADSGIGFVLVPHLDPKHESLMAELIAKHTTMPVNEAADGTPVEPNHVYVIPPNKYLAFEQGRLRLGPIDRSDRTTAIDFSLRSLALDQQERAMGIILSGTGSHGAQGLRDIKLAGGMVMVQDPASAQYEQMPRSAIDTGLADYILPPEGMPATLIEYARHGYVNGGEKSPPGAKDEPDRLGSILAVLRARTKYDFRPYRRNMLLRRIYRRMGLRHVDDLATYAAYLRAHEEEVAALCADFLIGVTSFFRDTEAFDVLAQRVIPDLVQRATPDAPVRVWVPGCATGEETYSIAILLLEGFARANRPPSFQVFATDVHQPFLDRARQGVYPTSIAADVSPDRLRRFFVKANEHHYQVSKSLRESIVFAPQNLIGDAPFSRLDLISCRNLLMYLEADTQRKVIELFHFALNEGGVLFLGSSETVSRPEALFEPVSRRWRIYRRNRARVLARTPVTAPLARAVVTPDRLTPLAEPRSHPSVDVSRLMQRVLLDVFAPAAILIDQHYKVLTVQGPVVQYLEFPPGELTRDLMAMARPGLRASIRTAVQASSKRSVAVVDRDARVKRDGRYVRCTLTVKPILEPQEARGLFLITLTEHEPRQAGDGGKQKRPATSARDATLVARLESELEATREALQSTIEEYETSAEELKASNEEVMSMNEEYQSTNEELETSREELQSLNEELNTVNSQLQEKVDELDRSSNDVANLLNSIDIATLFLDRDLHIRRFTPITATLTNVRTADVGRPLEELALNFTDPTLLADCRRVLDHLHPIDAEVQTHDGASCCLRRVLPYRTAGDRIEGVVVTLVDITSQKHAAAAIGEAQVYARMIEYLPAGAVYLNDGRLVMNKVAQAITGYGDGELPTLDAWFAALYGPRAAEVRRIYDRDRAAGFPQPTPMIALTRKDGQVRHVEFAGHTFSQDAEIWLMTDLTARHSAEQAVVDREALVRSIVTTAADAIISIDPGGIIQTVNPATERMFGYRTDELVGQNVRVLMPTPYRDEHDGYIARYRRTGEARIIGIGREVLGRRKDGTTFAADLAVSEIGPNLGFTGILRDISERQALERRLAEGRVEEARNLAQELHDGLGGEITGIGLIARALQNQLTRDGSPAAARADELVRSIETVHQRLRALARGFMPVELVPEGLMEALRALAERTTATAGVACDFNCPTPVYVDSLTTATHLFRIAQEAVSNAVRHGQPQQIVVRLHLRGGRLELEIADDGVGVEEPPATSGGLGLQSMHERARLLRGVLTIGPNPNGGTLVRCIIPGHDRAEASR